MRENLQADIIEQWRYAVDHLGVPATLASHRGLWTNKPVTVGLKTAGWQEQELVNSYGVGARIITFNSLDFGPDQHPEKFDRLTLLSGEVLVLAEVYPIHLGGQQVGYKGIARGDGS